MKRSLENFFAVTAPGLEAVCSAELAELRFAGLRPTAGGIEFAGNLEDLYRANLWLRSASRITVRVGEVGSRDFPDYFRKTVRLPWGKFIRPETRVRVRATSRSSRLVHTGRIAETAGAAINRALGRSGPPEQGPEQLILARFADDRCLFSADSSGDLLHRRGYRQEAVPAPLRETLAAGLLRLAGWDGRQPLLDPMCGSGTLVIEGALLASRLPPGRRRAFAFMNWPGFRPGLWQALLTKADAVRITPPPIFGADVSPCAVAAARGNAERAGVLDCLEFDCLDVVQLALPQVAPGLLLCNPPYGERLKSADLPGLYRTLGDVCRRSFPGWRAALFCPDPFLARATGLPLREAARLANGGLQVVLYTADLA